MIILGIKILVSIKGVKMLTSIFLKKILFLQIGLKLLQSNKIKNKNKYKFLRNFLIDNLKKYYSYFVFFEKFKINKKYKKEVKINGRMIYKINIEEFIPVYLIASSVNNKRKKL